MIVEISREREFEPDTTIYPPRKAEMFFRGAMPNIYGGPETDRIVASINELSAMDATYVQRFSRLP